MIILTEDETEELNLFISGKNKTDLFRTYRFYNSRSSGNYRILKINLPMAEVKKLVAEFIESASYSIDSIDKTSNFKWYLNHRNIACNFLQVDGTHTW